MFSGRKAPKNRKMARRGSKPGKKAVGKICRKNISVLTTPDPWCLTSAAGGS